MVKVHLNLSSVVTIGVASQSKTWLIKKMMQKKGMIDQDN